MGGPPPIFCSLEITMGGPPHILGGPPHLKFDIPPQPKQALCGHTQKLCELIDLKTLLENNFQGPTFIRGLPLRKTTPTTIVETH